MAGSASGKLAVCKTATAGSIPAPASKPSRSSGETSCSLITSIVAGSTGQDLASQRVTATDLRAQSVPASPVCEGG